MPPVWQSFEVPDGLDKGGGTALFAGFAAGDGAKAGNGRKKGEGGKKATTGRSRGVGGEKATTGRGGGGASAGGQRDRDGRYSSMSAAANSISCGSMGSAKGPEPELEESTKEACPDESLSSPHSRCLMTTPVLSGLGGPDEV